ncbi:hypothetical protein RvVAR0630_34160 [Agrobacterium vitis]|uniref:ParB N-terminal domain-containing protein n=1 Tax=Agrobacterium vitis TaxID=373 RepID=UPI0015D853E5|nr:ParB N-terminal domain-containing protein [Agrobacterium vitis]BCH60792.1 hypothetical protein RvVAR0630_34160 [Agrobacterium vitis]
MNDYNESLVEKVSSFVNVDDILPTEEHDVDLAKSISVEIFTKGIWTEPVLLLKEPLYVLDGHHRLAASIFLKFWRIPAFLVDKEDPYLCLGSWKPCCSITMESFLKRAATRVLYPQKTTRFSHPGRDLKVNVPIRELLSNIADFGVSENV